MELAFDTKVLRQICESKIKAKKEMGEDTADKLIHRLADLRAATCVHDLILGNPRSLNHSIKHQYVVDICDDISIFFCANHIKNPLLRNGDMNWSKVKRIKIIRIGDNNV